MMEPYSQNLSNHDLHIQSCGDPKNYSAIITNMISDTDIHWFPLRLSHANIALLEKTKAMLDAESAVEATYVPMSFMKVCDTKMDFSPLIGNIILYAQH